MWSVFISLVVALRAWGRSRPALHLEILALRHQLQILERLLFVLVILAHVPDVDGNGNTGSDGVRIGTARILTVSPNGTATAGTLYVHGWRRQYAVRISVSRGGFASCSTGRAVDNGSVAERTSTRRAIRRARDRRDPVLRKNSRLMQKLKPPRAQGGIRDGDRRECAWRPRVVLPEADGPSSAPLSALKFLESQDRDSRGGDLNCNEPPTRRGSSADAAHSAE